MPDQRAQLRRQLRRLGAKRRKGLETADEALKDIGAILPAALEAGITKTEVQRLTDVSRPTIDALLRERQ